MDHLEENNAPQTEEVSAVETNAETVDDDKEELLEQDPEIQALQAQLDEMEREMEGKDDSCELKDWVLNFICLTFCVSFIKAVSGAPSTEEKGEIDARSVFVGNVSNTTINETKKLYLILIFC